MTPEFDLWRTVDRKGLSTYWYTGRAYCDYCGKKVSHVGFHIANWSKRSPSLHFYCESCLNYIPPNTRSQDQRQVLITQEVPERALPVVLEPHRLVNSRNISVWQAAYKIDKDDNAEIIDLTRYANRDSEKLQLPKKEDVVKLKDVALETKEGLAYIDFLAGGGNDDSLDEN